MNNLLSYCGLVDARISSSDKDLPVILSFTNFKQVRFSQNTEFADKILCMKIVDVKISKFLPKMNRLYP